MTDQVARHTASVFLPGCFGPVKRDVVLGSDHDACVDALHAEAEALRAENGRLTESLRVAHHNLSVGFDTEASLTSQLEASRGLLREAAEDIESWGAYASAYFQEKHDLAGCAMKYRIAGNGDQEDGGAEQAAIAAMPLAATPAPEVQCRECNDTACDPSHEEPVPCPGCAAKPAHVDDFQGDDTDLVSSAKALLALDEKGALTGGGIGSHARTIIGAFIARMAEQGERQEVVVIRHPCRMWDGEHAESQEYAKGYNMALDHVEKLNTTPQPGPDVLGLVEAAQAFADAARPNIYPCPDKPHSLSGKLQALDDQLAAHRQAQRQA